MMMCAYCNKPIDHEDSWAVCDECSVLYSGFDMTEDEEKFLELGEPELGGEA